MLEGQQSGLSWSTILAKRKTYSAAYDHWDVQKISQYNQDKIEELLVNPGIVRNKLKINSVINNAKAFLKIQKEYGSFNDFIWAFVEGESQKNKWKNIDDVPVSTHLSDEMSKSLKKRGFKFIGSTTCYAFMQAVGMVNDHVVDCFRYKAV